jgi:hypothetical protein
MTGDEDMAAGEPTKEHIELAGVPAEAPLVPFAPKESSALLSATQVEKATATHVEMHFPKRVLLTTQNHQIIEFKAGVHKVPANLADHEWLKVNGVVRHIAEGPNATKPVTVMPGQTGAEARAAQEERDAAFKRLTTSLTSQVAHKASEPAPKPEEPKPVVTEKPTVVDTTDEDALLLAKAKAEAASKAAGEVKPVVSVAAPTVTTRKVAPKVAPKQNPNVRRR